MEYNPDIAALLSEARAAEIDRSAARSRFLPKLDIEVTDTKSVHAQGDPSSDGQHDKRIMLVDGEFAGAVNRVPAENDIRSNMVRGGAANR